MLIIKSWSDLVLVDIKTRLLETIGDNIHQILLFGSRSRGDAELDSDYDILLLVKEYDNRLEDLVDDIAYEMLDKHGVLVNIFAVAKETFQREIHEPLFRNIRRDGVAL